MKEIPKRILLTAFAPISFSPEEFSHLRPKEIPVQNTQLLKNSGVKLASSEEDRGITEIKWNSPMIRFGMVRKELFWYKYCNISQTTPHNQLKNLSENERHNQRQKDALDSNQSYNCSPSDE